MIERRASNKISLLFYDIKTAVKYRQPTSSLRLHRIPNIAVEIIVARQQ